MQSLHVFLHACVYLLGLHLAELLLSEVRALFKNVVEANLAHVVQIECENRALGVVQKHIIFATHLSFRFGWEINN